MAPILSPSTSRRLTAWFIVAAALPLALLGWLAWAVAAGDDEAERRRDRVADAAVTALERALADAEARLAALGGLQPDEPLDRHVPAAGETIAVVRFDRRGLVDRGGLRLPYYPAVSGPNPAVSQLFVEIDQAEHANPAKAVALLRPLAESTDPAVRAEALLRLARIHRRAGDPRRAEEAYRALAALEHVRAVDWPAGLVGRQGLALLLAAAGPTADLRQEAAALASALETGRWVITQGQYDNGLSQARGWLNAVDATGADRDRVVLAEAIDIAWRDWVADRSSTDGVRPRRSIRTPNGTTLVMSDSADDRLILLAAGSRFLQSDWLAAFSAAGARGDVGLALTDGDGLVLGTLEAPLADQSVRAAAATGLPWTLHASAPDRLGRFTVLVLTAIGITAALLLAGTYLMRRAVARELAVASRQSDFVAAVSHEFRTPLTTIGQLSELLAGGRVSSDGRRQEFYDVLLVESRRLQRLVEGLLNFGRMEAGAATYRLVPLDLVCLVREVVAEFAREPASAGFMIEVHAPASLPAIQGDQASLSRVLWNLLDNAVKYARDDRTIRVEIEQTGDRLAVRVRDRGMGIAPSEQADVFRKFVRGTAARALNIQGTGLGLAMVRHIVEAHGGTMSVESAVEQGSTFSIVLPLPGEAVGMSAASPAPAALPEAKS